MDTFVEQIVKQKLDAGRLMRIVGVAAAALLINILAVIFLPMVIILTLAAGGFGVWWVAASQSWEVEYSVTNGDIDIDRIISKSRRKRLVRVSGNKIESLLPVTPESRTRSYDRVVMAASSPQAATWYFTYHSKQGGHTIVFFEPEEKVLEALRRGLPRLVQIETDRALRSR